MEWKQILQSLVISYFLNNTIDHDSNYKEKVYILKYFKIKNNVKRYSIDIYFYLIQQRSYVIILQTNSYIDRDCNVSA